MTAPLVRVYPERRRFANDAELDDACAAMSAIGFRMIGIDDCHLAVFVPCRAERGSDRFYYVDGRPFTIDAVMWTSRDYAVVSWWHDDDPDDAMLLCSIVVDGCGTDVTYDSSCGEPEPPSYVLDAICARVRDAYPEHLHEWTY